MLNQVLQQQIEEILEPYRNFSPLSLAEHLGIKVTYIELEGDISGAIKKVDTDIILYVNVKQSENRQLFTIAHELGHYFLHSEIIESGTVSYRGGLSFAKYTPEEKIRENQANQFAAEFLMPRELILELYSKNRSSYKDIQKMIEFLAKELSVSEDAIKIRLSFLDLY